MCYELRDLRVSIRDFLCGLGITPQLSEEPGFLRISGDKPYVTCLRTLEECHLVIGVMERKYGQVFSDWSPYNRYSGLSPTHAEFKHTLNLGKKLLLYVHQSTIDAYSKWQKDPNGFAALSREYGPDIKTLELFHELKQANPAPFYEKYNDVSDIINSLKKNLINEIFISLKEQEKKNIDSAAYLMEQIHSAAPEIRKKVQEQLNPDLVQEMERLNEERRILELKLSESEQTSLKSIEKLQAEKADIEIRMDQLHEQINDAQLTLTLAAVRDARWINLVRTQLMPRQPSRVPFHNDAEVAIRGYHCSNIRGVPILKEVTWSSLPYIENKLHRGYHAGLIFKGSNFAPGVTFAYREKTQEPETMNIRWSLPNIYFGDYLEVSTSSDPFEGPLGYSGLEFAVKNPDGLISDWIEFSYAFDEPKLYEIMIQSAEYGSRLFTEGNYKEAIEPLRKAMVFAKKLLGDNSEETQKLWLEWNEALDNSTLVNLRFREGVKVFIKTGDDVGKKGIITKLGLRQTKPYWIELDDGRAIAVADEDVDLAE